MLGGGPAGVVGRGVNVGGGAVNGIPPWHDNPPLNTGVYAIAGPPKHEYADPKHEYPLPVQPYPLPVQP
jgi:hypothetical protein